MTSSQKHELIDFLNARQLPKDLHEISVEYLSPVPSTTTTSIEKIYLKNENFSPEDPNILMEQTKR